MRSIRLQVQPSVSPGARIPAIDELKGLALILVVLYHAGGVLGWTNRLHGEIGVDLFLLLSGFTLAVSSSTLPLATYFTRRFLRIYPAYWLALTVFLVGHRYTFGSRYPTSSVVLHYLGLQAYGGLSAFADVNDSFWFVSLIVVAYLVFAALRSRLDNLALVAGTCGALCLPAVLTYKHFGNVAGQVSLAVRIPTFFVGLVAGRLFGAGTAEIRFSFALGLGLSTFYYLLFFRNFPFYYTLPAIGLLLTWLPLRRLLVRVPLGRWGLRPIALLGVVSYEVYLFHQPIIRDYNMAFWAKVRQVPAPSRGQLAEGIGGGLILTLVIAIAVHLVLGWVFRRFTRPGSAVSAQPPHPVPQPIP